MLRFLRTSLIVLLLLPVEFSSAQNDAIVQRYLPQAQAGDAKAQYMLGAHYYQIHDNENARLWLKKSADQGNQQAAGMLNYFANGPGGMQMLATAGVCQYTFLLASGEQMTFADVPGGLKATTTRPGKLAFPALPDGLMDLPAAIAAAEKQGMRLPLKKAMLEMAQPRGKASVAVWTLTPESDPGGRVVGYFVAAADAGRPLALADVSDFTQDYNVRWQRIVDEFHAANAAKDQAGQGPGGACRPPGRREGGGRPPATG